ncbi:hypothetical protein SLA2020_294480 [Shorea laevis]
MSTAPNYLVFFLVIFFFFSASKALKEHKQQNDTVPIIHVINGMAKNSEAIQVGCSSKSAQNLDAPTLGYGQSHVWKVEFEKELYDCDGDWGNYFTYWHAYQPKRDTGRGALFWLVKENGIFFSRDNTSWVRKAVWQYD